MMVNHRPRLKQWMVKSLRVKDKTETRKLALFRLLG